MSANTIFWLVYFIFAGLALYLNWQPGIFAFSGDFGLLKLLVWTTLAAFLAYSIYCSLKENLFRTIGKMTEYHWGRQIGIDLYLGLSVALIIVYLNEGLLAVALWLIPTLLFANLSILLYLGIHFDSIVDKLQAF